MADLVEIQLLHPLVDVTTEGQADGPKCPKRRQEQALRQMQERLDAELAGLRSARAALLNGQAEFQKLQQNFLKEAEGQLLNLSIEIARKVLVQEIQADRYQVDPIIREALGRIPARTDAVVHLHPNDLARSDLARRDEQAPDSSTIRFIADPSVRQGECLVQTTHGTVESFIEERLEEIAGALKDSE